MKILQETIDGIRLYEMASIGTIKDDYEVRVYGKEGSIPHFHVTKGPGEHPTEECCICIRECKYFDHDSVKNNDKNVKDLRLNKDLLKRMIVMLNEPAGMGITKWQSVILMWNLQNPGEYRQVSDDQEMPDYTKLR